MRTTSLVALSILTACSFRVPRGIPVHVTGKATVRANVRVQGSARVDTVVVPMTGAPVTEFFGIPLAGAREVVFVLDISGSMSDPAEGQLAMIPVAPPPPVDQASPEPANAPPSTSPPDAPPSTSPPPDAPPSTSPPPPPDAPPSTSPPDAPPPMGYPPGYPPPPRDPPPHENRIGTRVPTKLEVAQAELIEAIAKLPPGTRINLLIFSDEIDAYAPTMVVVDESTRADLISFVRAMRAVGATALQPAMRITFLLNASRIVLLSDGLGNIGGGREDILRDVREAVRGGVRIDAIGIGRGQDTKLLSALAGETGGLYQAL